MILKKVYISRGGGSRQIWKKFTFWFIFFTASLIKIALLMLMVAMMMMLIAAMILTMMMNGHNNDAGYNALKSSLVLRRVLLTFGLRRWPSTENPPNLAWVWRISRNILSTLQDYRTFSLLPPISQQLSLSSGLRNNTIRNRFRINRAQYKKKSSESWKNALSLYDLWNSIADK